MPKALDLNGKDFGRLYVLGRTENSPDGRSLWLVQCSCKSAPFIVKGTSLTQRKIRSCGCLQKEKASRLHKIHGEAGKTPEYAVWSSMKDRCYNPRNKDFDDYGGRGIKVCDRWLDSYENFLEDIGRRPSGNYSINRIDNDGDYCPENCIWSTVRAQARNRRSNCLMTLNGKTKCLSEWAEEYEISYDRLYSRLKLGWTLGEALTIPKYGKRT